MGVLVAGGLTGLLNQSSAQVIDSSLKFNDDSSNVLNRTPSAAGNRKTWTWSGWVKRTTLGTEGGIFSTYAGAHPNTSLFWESEALKFHDYTGSYNIRLGTSAVFRDPSAWYHIVLAYNSTESTASDRAKLYVNGTLQTLSGTTVPSNFQTDWNSTTEHNIGAFAAYFDGSMSQCYFIDGQALGPGYFGFTDPLTNTWRPKKFRAVGTTINDGTTWSSYGDGNAASSYEWTHAFDGSFGANDYVTGTATYTTITFPEAIQAENIYLFLGTGTTAGLKINGVQITDVVGAYNNSARYKVGSNGEGNFLKTISLYNSGTQWSILYAIEVGGVLMRDGITQNLAFGTNGFYLPMDNDDFHIDKSGNGNNWTKQNFSGTFNDPDVLKDSPSGAVSGGRAQTGITTTSSAPSNYATFNPLIKPSGGDSQGSGGSLSDGNLTIKSGGSTGNYRLASCSPSIPLTGKYYFEFTTISAIHTDNNTIGIFNPASPVYSSGDYARINPSFSGSFTTTKKRSGTATNLAGSAGDFSGGDVVNIAIDSDKRSIWFGKNGVYYEGNPSSGTGASYTNLTTGVEYAVRSFVYNSGGTQAEGRINFGQKPFKYAPPQGFLPLNSASTRPETVIVRPDHYVKTVLWTGNDVARSIVTGNAPDFVWIKNRSSSRDYVLCDTVRGAGKTLRSNDTTAEQTAIQRLSAFSSNGFSVGTDTAVNNNNENIVAWTWKAGGSKNTFNVDDVGYANASDVGMNVGALNSSFYNTSQVWSDDVTKGTGNVYSNNIYVPANIFNGNTSSYCRVEKGSNSNTVSMQLSSTISGVTKIRVNTNSVDNFNINGGSNIAATNGYQTIYEGSAITLSDLDFTRTNGVSSGNSDTALFVYSIEINGLELLDSGVTPSSNFPSIAATGASVGTRQGFSIIKYTGNSTANATLPHGLSEAPKFVIIKNLSNTYGWAVLHTDAGTTGTTLDGSPEYYMLQLDEASARANFSQDTIWNPTSTTVKIDQSGGANWVNNSNSSYIAYLWHDVPGLQKFGKYEGNSSNDGPYVELGFRPAVLLIKRYDNTGNWILVDNKRNEFNVVDKQLIPNSSGADYTEAAIDFVSNGFKVRLGSSGHVNIYDFVYAAWAESPVSNLYGGQSNAR